VTITGPIFRYSNLFTQISGATSTEILAKDIQTALDDPSVNRIVLNVDSPGGEVAGISELSNMILEGRRRKRISAYVGRVCIRKCRGAGSTRPFPSPKQIHSLPRFAFAR
jgi:ClpP class serine protease